MANTNNKELIKELENNVSQSATYIYVFKKHAPTYDIHELEATIEEEEAEILERMGNSEEGKNALKRLEDVIRFMANYYYQKFAPGYTYESLEEAYDYYMSMVLSYMEEEEEEEEENNNVTENDIKDMGLDMYRFYTCDYSYEAGNCIVEEDFDEDTEDYEYNGKFTETPFEEKIHEAIMNGRTNGNINHTYLIDSHDIVIAEVCGG